MKSQAVGHLLLHQALCGCVYHILHMGLRAACQVASWLGCDSGWVDGRQRKEGVLAWELLPRGTCKNSTLLHLWQVFRHMQYWGGCTRWLAGCL